MKMIDKKILQLKYNRQLTLNILLIMITIILISFYFIFNSYTNLNNILVKNNYDYTWIENKSLQLNNKSISNLSIGEFEYFISKIYVYEKTYKDCKYWSYFYKNYFDELGYETKYVLSEKHLFVVVYVKDGYIIFDGKVFSKIRLIS